MPDRLTLLGIQRGIRRTIAGTKRRVPSQALLSQANNVPFAGDDLAGGDLAGEPFVPHITARLSHGLNVAQSISTGSLPPPPREILMHLFYLFSMFNDLRYAFRQLLKNPGFTAVAVLMLALGIGATAAVWQET